MSDVTVSEQTVPPQNTPSKPVLKKRKRSLERFMLLMIAVFFGGVILLTVLPEGPAKGFALAVYTPLVYWLILRYGL